MAKSKKKPQRSKVGSDEDVYSHLLSLLLPKELTVRHFALVVIFLLLSGGFALQVRLSFLKYGRTAMTVSDLEVEAGLRLPRLAVCPGFKVGAFEEKGEHQGQMFPHGKGMNSYFDARNIGKQGHTLSSILLYYMYV